MTSPETDVEQPLAADALDEEGAAASRRSLRRRLARVPWHIPLFLLPAFAIYTTFMVYPLLDSLRLSFFSEAGDYVGLDNFRTLFGDSNYNTAFWNALENN